MCVEKTTCVKCLTEILCQEEHKLSPKTKLLPMQSRKTFWVTFQSHSGGAPKLWICFLFLVLQHWSRKTQAINKLCFSNDENFTSAPSYKFIFIIIGFPSIRAVLQCAPVLLQNISQRSKKGQSYLLDYTRYGHLFYYKNSCMSLCAPDRVICCAAVLLETYWPLTLLTSRLMLLLQLTLSAMVRPSLSILEPASAIFLAALMTSDVFFSGPFPLQKIEQKDQSEVLIYCCTAQYTGLTGSHREEALSLVGADMNW